MSEWQFNNTTALNFHIVKRRDNKSLFIYKSRNSIVHYHAVLSQALPIQQVLGATFFAPSIFTLYTDAKDINVPCIPRRAQQDPCTVSCLGQHSPT
jgi:hypothetical protein